MFTGLIVTFLLYKCPEPSWFDTVTYCPFRTSCELSLLHMILTVKGVLTEVFTDTEQVRTSSVPWYTSSTSVLRVTDTFGGGTEREKVLLHHVKHTPVLEMWLNILFNSAYHSEAWEEYSSGLLGLVKDFVLSVWEERKVRLYGEHANVHQSHSQNDSGDLRSVAGGDGELGCLCGKAGTSHLCDGSAHSSGCVVNGYGCRLSYY